MATIPLVERQVEEGGRLLAELDATAMRVEVALWFFSAESEAWRLVLATPLVHERGLKEAYKLVLRLVYPDRGEGASVTSPRGHNAIDAHNLMVVPPEHPMIVALRDALAPTPPGEAWPGFVTTWAGDIFFEDAYVYRCNPKRSASPRFEVAG